MKKIKFYWNIKVLLFAVLAVFSFILISCEKDEVVKVQPPSGNCDTINITFAQDIEPVIKERCEGCHSNSTQLAGVNLEGYENIKSHALDGSLVSSIEGTMFGYFYKSGDTTSACKFLQLKAWINKGAPNN
jgi:uncharacterized membrane protein